MRVAVAVGRSQFPSTTSLLIMSFHESEPGGDGTLLRGGKKCEITRTILESLPFKAFRVNNKILKMKGKKMKGETIEILNFRLYIEKVSSFAGPVTRPKGPVGPVVGASISVMESVCI